ncbi:MAG: Ldh family oxidoreductase [Betaproteobacteria bacterium]|nr:Ldh family oxidoreductase [Betaproteobacteria bacterium]
MPRIALSELQQLAQAALERAGATTGNAASTARALVYADAQGLSGHGVSRVAMYAAHMRHGRIDGAAIARVIKDSGGAVLVDAADGLAFPACELAIATAIERARRHGIAFAGVTNSHHAGAAGYHLEAVAGAKMVGLAFTNSPYAMPAAGGKRPIFGTNPIAAVFPRASEPALLVDLSLSEVARGKLMVAAKEGKAIPLGWALDKDGNPTTDPRAGLEGSMLPVGGTKGAMLALMVELLCCALTGARMGFEADSFFVDAGNKPRIGQAFIIIDPAAVAGREVFFERVETLIQAMLRDEGVRLPGARRYGLARKAEADGVEIPASVLDTLRG